MNSINANQLEQNHADLGGAEALTKIRELVSQAQTCFLCTSIQTNHRIEVRPMAVQQIDDHGRLWFLSASDSHQNKQLAHDPAVQLLFQGSAHSDFLTLYGRAAISRDEAKIKELWNPLLKTWFTEGMTDPRITTIAVTPSDGYYWDSKHNRAIQFAKMAIGAITGKTLDDSIEGKLRV